MKQKSMDLETYWKELVAFVTKRKAAGLKTSPSDIANFKRGQSIHLAGMPKFEKLLRKHLKEGGGK